MRLTGKQKRGIEIITGRSWRCFDKKALEAYFAFTDRGVEEPIIGILGKDWKVWCAPIALGVATDLQRATWELICSHRWHPVIAEMWKRDFERGWLFLDDFLGGTSPANHINHAIDTYLKVFGAVPRKYLNDKGEINAHAESGN